MGEKLTKTGDRVKRKAQPESGNDGDEVLMRNSRGPHIPVEQTALQEERVKFHRRLSLTNNTVGRLFRAYERAGPMPWKFNQTARS